MAYQTLQKRKAAPAQPTTTAVSTPAAARPAAAIAPSGESMGPALEQALLQRVQDRFIQRQIPAAEREADDLAAAAQGARTPAQVKEKMGQALGADFSTVRFHTGSDAVAQATGMGARAYAASRDVYFGLGGFDPAIAAHELVHTVQQGAVPSAVATVSAPLGGVQMAPLDIAKMNFGKRSYRRDKDYQALQQLMIAYNNSDNDPAAKSALMEAAMQYIDRFSTGKKAVHKGRTAMAEDLLFQLSTDGTQQRDARANLTRFQTGMQVDAHNSEDEQSKRAVMGTALGEMEKILRGSDGYSKAMQMATTGVLSQLGGQVNFTAGGKSETRRLPGTDHYEIGGRAFNNPSDSLSTTLHEMTHAASGRVYNNSDTFYTVRPDATPEELRQRRDSRTQRMNRIRSLYSEEDTAQSLKPTTFDELRSGWIDERARYATSGKTLGEYMPGQRYHALKTMLEAQGVPLPADPLEKKGFIECHIPLYDYMLMQPMPELPTEVHEALIENQAAHRKVMSTFGPNDTMVDSLVEYDPVVNQTLAEYEYNSSDRESPFYRNLKAAVLRSHVDRQKELLRKEGVARQAAAAEAALPPYLRTQPQPQPAPAAAPAQPAPAAPVSRPMAALGNMQMGVQVSAPLDHLPFQPTVHPQPQKKKHRLPFHRNK